MAFGPHWQHAWLVIASFIAGALNAMAGGGSFVSFPALLGVGVLPIQANATNTVALWPGQFTSIAAYWQDLKANLRLVVPVCSAALLGGLTGAIVLLRTGQVTFMALVPWLLLLAAGLFAASGPVSSWLRTGQAPSPTPGPALSRYGLVWWWCVFTSDISAPAPVFYSCRCCRSLVSRTSTRSMRLR